MHKLLQFRDFDQYKVSAWALVAANALPLFGVLFLGWDIFSIVSLYWSECVVVGAINVLKMITCTPEDERLILGDVNPNDKLNRERMERSRAKSVKFLRLASQGSKLFDVPFFIVHYGMFCLVDGAILFEFFGHGSHAVGLSDEIRNFADVFTAERLWWCVAAIAASHLYSFFVNYIRRGEYRRTTVNLQMFQPYGRIIILHIAIILGGVIGTLLGGNLAILMMLIAGKTLFDLSLHLLERQRHAPAETPPPIMPDVLTGEREVSLPTRAASER